MKKITTKKILEIKKPTLKAPIIGELKMRFSPRFFNSPAYLRKGEKGPTIEKPWILGIYTLDTSLNLHYTKYSILFI